MPEKKENMRKDYRAELPAGIAIVFMSWVCPDYGSFADSKDVDLVMKDWRMKREDLDIYPRE